VGHLNLASYVDNELEWNISHARKVLVKDGDDCHPNEFGHAVLAHLLLDLVVDKERAENITTAGMAAGNNPVAKTSFQWACGTETESKRFVQNRVLSKNASSRTTIQSPLASFTFELPRNEEIYPGMLVHVPNYATPIVTLFKSNPPVRYDRQDSIVVPCCQSNQTIHFTIPFHQSKPLERIQALQLGMDQCLTTKIQVFLDGQLVPNRKFAPMGWDCTWNFRDQYPGLRWLALEQEWDASSIQFCVAQDKCCREEGATGSCSKLLSLVVY
jgi:hypothetical protein